MSRRLYNPWKALKEVGLDRRERQRLWFRTLRRIWWQMILFGVIPIGIIGVLYWLVMEEAFVEHVTDALRSRIMSGRDPTPVFLTWSFVLHAGQAVLLLVPVFILDRRLIRPAIWGTMETEGYRLCRGCGYDLRELPETHDCPECGPVGSTRTDRLHNPSKALKQVGTTWRERRRIWSHTLSRVWWWFLPLMAVIPGQVLFLQWYVLPRVGLAGEAHSLLAFFVPASFILFNAAFLVCWFHIERRWMRPAIWKTMEQEGYRLCRGCGYDLREIPQTHDCPECGQVR